MSNRGLIRPYDSQLQLFQRIVDALLIIASLRLAASIYNVPWHDQYMIFALVLVGIFYTSSKITHLYQSYRVGGMIEEIQRVTATWVLTIAGGLVFGYVFKTTHIYSRVAIGIAIIGTPLILIVWRWVIRQILMSMRNHGRNTRSVVIVGTNQTARELARSIDARPWTGLRIKGFVSEKDEIEDKNFESEDENIFSLVGNLNNLYEKARSGGVDMVYIAIPLNEQKVINEILHNLGDTTVSIYLVPDMFLSGIMQGHWVTVGAIPTVSVIDSPVQGFDSVLKRLEDVVVSLLVITVMTIPMALIAIGIKITSAGPVIYKQKRYGYDCKPITVYKFRTMTVVDDDNEIVQAKKYDNRITPFGSFLRKTSLDELPQFFNVLKGDMSVVGPRPHAVAHNEEFRKRIEAYTLRHKIKPGITGLAQINGLRGLTETDASMTQRISKDLEYINNWSIWMDLKIILATPFALIKGENAF